VYALAAFAVRLSRQVVARLVRLARLDKPAIGQQQIRREAR